ncbi:MAG: uncharacterized protein QG641_455 [Candidatus Poribacteria bacterium]|nr:uncharacterized protein [Candidatus Poribacteria bacterium]
MANRTLSSNALQDIVHRIVNVAHPERIIMFGSSARGEMGPDSDVDLLVIKGGEYRYHKLLGDIYMNLHGVEEAVDVILVTPEQVEKYKDTHCLVISPALKENPKVRIAINFTLCL